MGKARTEYANLNVNFNYFFGQSKNKLPALLGIVVAVLKSDLLDTFMRPYSSAEAKISQTKGLSTPKTYSQVLGSKR